MIRRFVDLYFLCALFLWDVFEKLYNGFMKLCNVRVHALLEEPTSQLEIAVAANVRVWNFQRFQDVQGVLSRHPEVVSSFVSPQASFERCISTRKITDAKRCEASPFALGQGAHQAGTQWARSLQHPTFFDHLFKWRVALESPPYHLFLKAESATEHKRLSKDWSILHSRFVKVEGFWQIDKGNQHALCCCPWQIRVRSRIASAQNSSAWSELLWNAEQCVLPKATIGHVRTPSQKETMLSSCNHQQPQLPHQWPSRLMSRKLLWYTRSAMCPDTRQ